MKKQCKKWILLWMALTLVITSIQPFSFKEVFAAAKKEIYSDETCKIYYQTMSEWETGFEGQICIENVSTNPIENWKLQFTFNQDIKSIWDGEIASHKGDTYILKHPSWNSKIPAGGKAVIGFNGSKKGKIETPKNCKILMEKSEVNQENYSIKYRTTSDWKDGFNGEIAITNHTNKSIEGWQLEFDFAASIQNFWTAKLISHKGNHYVIKNDDWNSVIKPKQTIILGFGGSPGNISTQPENFKLIASKDNDVAEEESSLSKEEEEKIKKTDQYLEETQKVLSNIDYNNLAETVKKLEQQEGVSNVTQEGDYLDIVYKTGVKQSVIASTETNLSKQLRGGGTEDKFEDLSGTEDKFEEITKKDSGSYYNQNLIDLRKKYAKYQEDDNCSELKNRKILLWIPMDSKWGEYDEVKIMKQIVKAEDNLDIELNIVSDEKATTDALKDLDKYGIVIFASHGHNAEWLMTGEPYKSQMSNETKEALLKDEQRIVTLSNKKKIESYYGVTPKWFDRNIKKNLPGTIVYNNSCGSIKTDAMWEVFKNKGASTYLGYDGNVRNEFAIMNLTLFFTSFIDERQSAFNSSSFMVDKYYSKKGSSFVPTGQGNYKIARDYTFTVSSVMFPKHKAPKIVGGGEASTKIHMQTVRSAAGFTASLVWTIVDALIAAIGAASATIVAYVIAALAVVIVGYNIAVNSDLWNDIKKKIKSKSVAAWEEVETEVQVVKQKNKYAETAVLEREYDLCVIQKRNGKNQVISVKIKNRYVSARKFVFEIELNVALGSTEKVALTANINRSDSKYGTYSKIASGEFGVVEFGKTYKIECPKKTGHYKITYHIKSLDPNTLTVDYESLNSKNYYCLNRTGHNWAYNQAGKTYKWKTHKTLKEPETNWKKLKHDEYETSRNVKHIEKYLKEYNEKYKTNYTKKDLVKNGYQIHHIMPVVYGGKHELGNLIHLNEIEHTPITAWFNAYDS